MILAAGVAGFDANPRVKIISIMILAAGVAGFDANPRA